MTAKHNSSLYLFGGVHAVTGYFQPQQRTAGAKITTIMAEKHLDELKKSRSEVLIPIKAGMASTHMTKMLALSFM